MCPQAPQRLIFTASRESGTISLPTLYSRSTLQPVRGSGIFREFITTFGIEIFPPLRSLSRFDGMGKRFPQWPRLPSRGIFTSLIESVARPCFQSRTDLLRQA